MAAQKQGDQLEHTFSSYVRIQDVVLKTYLGRWTIGRSGERGSGISVLPARYDDDDTYMWNHNIHFLHNDDDKFVTTHKGIFFLSNPQLSRLLLPSATHRYTYIHVTASNLPRGSCIIIQTHTLTITYTITHNNTQIGYTHIHTHIHIQKGLCTILT